MSRCTYCNWATHDVSYHERLCVNGHPLDVVGVYKDGRCRACQRAASKRWRDAHLEQARERWRRWYANRRGAGVPLSGQSSVGRSRTEHTGLVLLEDQDGPLISIGSE